jgi:hypothetical protein
MPCNPICGVFMGVLGAVRKKLVGTHLKPPFKFQFMGMQEQNNDLFFIKVF